MATAGGSPRQEPQSRLRPFPVAFEDTASRGTTPVAVLNGKLLGVGEIIAGYRVSAITPSSVELSRAGVTRTLTLVPGERGGMLEIALNAPIELDFLSKARVFALRRTYALAYPELVGTAYAPSEAVFGGIEDKKSWIGIVGMTYYGYGMHVIDGPSEESRFIANPYLLVGLHEPHSYDLTRQPGLKPRGIYPRPRRLQWRCDSRVAMVTYDVTQFLADAAACRHHVILKDRRFDLIAYNARDLGLAYCAVDPEGSREVVAGFSPGRVYQIPFMLHCGGSSRYPGGSNNMSPSAPAFSVVVKKLPARVSLKLWYQRPVSADDAPDMVFVIDMR